MQEDDKKQKKQDIEKLRMILDNPHDPASLSKDDPLLNSVRRRLSGETPDQRMKRLSAESSSKSLAPQVTIHERAEYRKPLYPESSKLEPEKPKQPVIVPKPAETLVIKTEDLYEIEKVDIKQVRKDEHLPEWIPADAQQPIEQKTLLPKTKEENLPEWTPVEVHKVAEPTSVPPKKPQVSEELPIWREAKEEVKSPLSPVKPQPEFIEKPKEVQPPVDREEKIVAFKELPIIDESTAELLYTHGVTSVEKLRASAVRDLIASGVEKPIAKKIKKDIKKWDKETAKKTKQAAKKTITVSVETVSPNGKVTSWRSSSTTSVSTTVTEPKEQSSQPKGEEPAVWEEVDKTKQKEDWAPRHTRRSTETASSSKISETEWESSQRTEIKSMVQTTTPYTYGEHVLYKKEVITADGKTRTIHFFSKKKPDAGEPTTIPEGFEVRMNKKTGLPYLKKKI